MRHGNKINHLGRKYAHRKAMLGNMGVSLIMHKRIKTTLAKAKELRVYIEPIINRAKEDNTHNRREVFSHLQDKEAVNELFTEIAGKIAGRNGGYTRILKIAETRVGDSAETAYIELVDYNENMLKDVKKKATSTRRRKPSAKKAEGTEVKAAEVVATEEPIVDAAEENNNEATDSNEEEKKD